MNQQSLPLGLSLGVILIFMTMVLGVCLLVVFLYNLPVIFPPPGANNQVAGLATVVPTATPSATPPTPLPPPTATRTPTPPPVPPSVTPTRPAVAPPVAAPSPRQIVFVTERNGFNSIFIMNPDGSEQRPLVPRNGNYYDYAPAVSPDSRRLAFSSNREKPGTDNIYLMNLDGSGLTQITNTPNAKNASSSWFPDGRRLAFTSTRDGLWQAYTMNDDGSNVRRIIVSDQHILNVALSPDGSKLAYTCGKEICLANPDSSGQRVLLQNGLAKDHLTWSPDSNLLGLTQANPNSNKTSLYVLDMQGNSRQVVSNGGWSAWSPDGATLVFSSDIGGVANLYLYTLETGQVRQLTKTGKADYTPVWVR
ncbi:MAG: PD40 domain-containing protein [Chloroflexi bacterium]|nr:PD40 domain-containing protein [Chloroflexota bacterium]